MADEIFDNDDELAVLKRWWAENYKAVIAGVMIALIIIGVWYGWPAYKQSQVEAAAEVYVVEFETARDAQDYPAMIAAGQKLVDEHDSTVYASLAALQLAKIYYVDQQNPEKAAAQLRWVMDDGDDAYQALARVRLANVLIDQNQADEAKSLLAGDPAEGVEARWLERRGDALLALAENAAAKAAYEAALTHDPANVDSIELKLYNLNGALSVAQTTESEAATHESNNTNDDVAVELTEEPDIAPVVEATQPESQPESNEATAGESEVAPETEAATNQDAN